MRLVLPTITTSPPDTDRPNGVWDYISASRLNLWLRCPLAFRLRYIDGIVTPPTASLFLGQQ
ncbi:MAG: PD-(D/E)XK nuclease family protein, partial [Pirellulaceae bacterium]